MDDLRVADVVVRAVLVNAEPGPEAICRDDCGLDSSVVLTFETIATYKGSDQAVWRVIWRGGEIDHVRQDAGHDDFDRRFPSFDGRDRNASFQIRSAALIGGIYVVGIVPADKQFLGNGCRDSCFPNETGGCFPELLTTHSSAGAASAYFFSDALEDRVVRMLAEAQ